MPIPAPLALVLALASAAPAARHAGPAVVTIAAPVAAEPATLRVAVSCDDCASDEAPALTLTWRGKAGAPDVLRGVKATDWQAGRFALEGEGFEAVALAGQPAGSGWLLDIPLEGRGLPFRLVGSLEGHAAERAAWWPAQGATPPELVFHPVTTVLDAHPDWDPSRTSECETVVPKTASLPLTFSDAGQPRAWLFPARGAAPGVAEHGWVFQFAVPGACPLQRLSVPVTAADDGDGWAFRLPLQAVLGAPAAPVRLEASGIGPVDLGACPRLLGSR